MQIHTGENYLFHLAWLKFLTFFRKKVTLNQYGNSTSHQKRANYNFAHKLKVLNQKKSIHLTGMARINGTSPFLPPTNEVWGKVIFSVACVKNSVHGGWGVGLPQCMLGYPPPTTIPPRSSHSPRAGTPHSRHPTCAVYAGRYGQQVGGMHPTGMQSRCCMQR